MWPAWGDRTPSHPGRGLRTHPDLLLGDSAFRPPRPRWGAGARWAGTVVRAGWAGRGRGVEARRRDGSARGVEWSEGKRKGGDWLQS